MGLAGKTVIELDDLRAIVKSFAKEAVAEERVKVQTEVYLSFPALKDALHSLTGQKWSYYLIRKEFNVIERKDMKNTVKLSDFRRFEKFYIEKERG